jgi:peptidoglycan/xylan/chitin deacetylase (PgdA/CDA1 family)
VKLFFKIDKFDNACFIRLAQVLSLLIFFNLENKAWACKRFQCPNGETYPIHLTFDDGPDLQNTQKVLEILKKHNIKATFFVIGEEVAKSSEKQRILDEIISEKHGLGSHSYQHVHHSTLSHEELLSQILRSKKTLSKWLTTPYLFRLPYGDGWPGAYTKNKNRSNAIMAEIKNAGFTHVGWQSIPLDWDIKTQRQAGILKIMTKDICASKGGVVVLHDTQDNTVVNLSQWIDTLKCVGHKFVPLAELHAPNSPAPKSKSESKSSGAAPGNK